MNRIQYPPIYLGLYVLLITAVIAVITAQASGASLLAAMLFWAFLYGGGLFSGWRFNQTGSKSFKKVTDSIAGLVLLLFVVALFSMGFDKAFLLLLIGIQAARNFSLSTRRDFYYSYVISLVIILYAASLSKEAFFLVYIIIYALAGMFTLMADHIDDTLSRAQGGDREVLVRRMSLPVKGVGLAVTVTALAVLIYLLVPRPTSPHVQAFPAGGGWTYNNTDWERQAKMDEQRGPERQDNTDPGAGSPYLAELRDDSWNSVTPEYGGFQNRFDITTAGADIEDSIVFYLQADQPLYVRLKTFDLFDGRSWAAGKGRGKKIRGNSGFILDKHYHGAGTGQTFSIAADLPTSHIPSAYRPVKVWFPGGVISKEKDLALRAPGVLRKGTIYSVLSDMSVLNNRPFSAGEPVGDLRKMLQVPDNLSSRVKELGGSLTQNYQGALAKAEAIESYLRENYSYTEATALVHPDSDVIDKFLFEEKQGHCEYFATSMVVMLRTIHVPARLATGYAAFRENAITGYYDVRKKNAHAWVEANIEGYGWMTFEPTSSFELPRGSRRMMAASGVLGYLDDRLSSAAKSNPGAWWAEAIRMIVEFFKQLWETLKKLFRILVKAAKYILIWFSETGWLLFLALLAASGIAYFFTIFIANESERVDLARLRKKDARQFIIRCYREMEKILARKKLPRQPYCTPSEYTSLIAAHLPQLVPSVELITSLFNRARYSTMAIDANEADSVFEAYRYILRFINNKPEEKR